MGWHVTGTKNNPVTGTRKKRGKNAQISFEASFM